MRKNIKFGDPSSIKGIMDDHGASSEGEHSGEVNKEVKKPRLGESSGTHEEDNNIKILENENMAEDKAKNSEGFSEGKLEEKDHIEGLKEGDKIMQDLLDMHEDVSLEDPGPNIAGEDREEEEVPLEDPGPNIAGDTVEEGVAGATQ